jgi:hypothetical protein
MRAEDQIDARGGPFRLPGVAVAPGTKIVAGHLPLRAGLAQHGLSLQWPHLRGITDL